VAVPLCGERHRPPLRLRTALPAIQRWINELRGRPALAPTNGSLRSSPAPVEQGVEHCVLGGVLPPVLSVVAISGRAHQGREMTVCVRKHMDADLAETSFDRVCERA